VYVCVYVSSFSVFVITSMYKRRRKLVSIRTAHMSFIYAFVKNVFVCVCLMFIFCLFQCNGIAISFREPMVVADLSSYELCTFRLEVCSGVFV